MQKKQNVIQFTYSSSNCWLIEEFVFVWKTLYSEHILLFHKGWEYNCSCFSYATESIQVKRVRSQSSNCIGLTFFFSSVSFYNWSFYVCVCVWLSLFPSFLFGLFNASLIDLLPLNEVPCTRIPRQMLFIALPLFSTFLLCAHWAIVIYLVILSLSAAFFSICLGISNHLSILCVWFSFLVNRD